MNEHSSLESQIAALTKIFTEAGIRAPRAWAESEITEHLSHFVAFSITSNIWKAILNPNDEDWIDSIMNSDDASDPLWDIQADLKEVVASGIDKRMLTRIVRAMQIRSVSQILGLLSDSGRAYPLVPGAREPNWDIFEVNDDGLPIYPVGPLNAYLEDSEPRN
jgi:hypothetical protein